MADDQPERRRLTERRLTLRRVDNESEWHPHPVGGWYCERFWLPVVGPSGLLLGRLVAAQAELTTTPETLARMVGLGGPKVVPVLRRLEQFRLGSWHGRNGFDVLSHWPRLTGKQIGQLPDNLRTIHAALPNRATVERSLLAEVRAVEEGHRALLEPAGWVRVVSDTVAGKSYRVDAWGTDADGLVVFACRPESGPRLYEDDHLRVVGAPGVLPCKHAGVAARRLEREGLAVVDELGAWRATEKGAELGRSSHLHDFATGVCPCGEPADPFVGLPS